LLFWKDEKKHFLPSVGRIVVCFSVCRQSVGRSQSLFEIIGRHSVGRSVVDVLACLYAAVDDSAKVARQYRNTRMSVIMKSEQNSCHEPHIRTRVESFLPFL
jgi:hypothetical protein